jgi:hypothetical protein
MRYAKSFRKLVVWSIATVVCLPVVILGILAIIAGVFIKRPIVIVVLLACTYLLVRLATFPMAEYSCRNLSLAIGAC